MDAAAADTPADVARFSGEVAFLFAYDMERRAVALLGQALERYPYGPDKRRPREPFLFRPHTARLPSVNRQIAPGDDQPPPRAVLMACSMKPLPVGALSIVCRVPLADCTLDERVAYHDLRFIIDLMLLFLGRG